MTNQKFRAGQQPNQPSNLSQPDQIVRVFRIRVGFYPTGAKRVVSITFASRVPDPTRWSSNKKNPNPNNFFPSLCAVDSISPSSAVSLSLSGLLSISSLFGLLSLSPRLKDHAFASLRLLQIATAADVTPKQISRRRLPA